MEDSRVVSSPQFLSPVGLQNGDVNFFVSKLYGPPKRRRMSAIRDLPLGFGTGAASSRKAGSDVSVTLLVNEAEHITGEGKVLIENNGERETVEVRGETAATSGTYSGFITPACSENNEDVSNVQDASPNHETDENIVNPKVGLLASQQQDFLKGYKVVQFCGSKLYGPSKRRKVSVLRDFPPGCGPYITKMLTGCTKNVVTNLSDYGIKPVVENKILVEADDKALNMDNVGSSISKVKGSMRPGVENKALVDTGGKRVKLEISGACEVKGRTDETTQNHKQIQENGCEQADFFSQNNILKDNSISEGNNEQIVVVKYNSVLRRAEEISEDIFEDFVSKVGPESSNKLASSVGCKKFKEYFREDSDGILEGNLKETNGYYRNKNKVLDKTTIKSKLGCVSSHALAKNQYEKSMDNIEVRATKRCDVGCQKKTNNKRNCAQDESGVQILLQERGENMDFEAPRSKLIVQALMAVPNCPWMGERHSGETAGFRSVRKVKDKKISDKISSTPRLSDSQELILFEDRKDHLPMNEESKLSPPGSQELSVMLMPVEPPNPYAVEDSSGRDSPNRNRVRRVLRLFQVICRKLLQGEESKSRQPGQRNRIDLVAANILKKKNEWVNTGKPILGIVPGVEIGDEFHYRTELSIVGLHRPFQGGIDSIKRGNIWLTTSIVAGGSADELDGSDVLIYSGSGGVPGCGDKPPEDQKLERGNLALKNSIDAKEPVRVIRGSKETKSDPRDRKNKHFSTFIYDGLYLVEKYWKEKVPQGFFALKYQLRRMPGQPELAWKEVKKSKKPSARPGVCVGDISDGKERIPICAVNTLDDECPSPFTYITKNMYPATCFQKPPRGCSCTNGCSDSGMCACALKNGGEIPFNYNGAIVQAKPLVYECGPSCKCPLTCPNRVSQHGVQIQLEVFKTKSVGWGVRSLSSIPSGSFICEYMGELLPDSVAEQRENDEFLFDIGHNYEDTSLWEGLPAIIPDPSSNAVGDTVEGIGFTIDAAKFGNVGRFINHSCSPNLYAQNVLYDHDDRSMPHIMFFAAENIPPLQELTYHYNYNIDGVHDQNGNIKRKDCHCGSDECTGRLY